MLDKKKINNASIAYARATWNHDEHQYFCMDGFNAGANWAIKEFLKDLWKGPEIEPKIKHQIIAISYEYPPLMLKFFNESTYDWKHFSKLHNIERWCYLDDILPQKGGEE